MELQHSSQLRTLNRQYDRRSAWQLSIAMAAIGVVTLVGLFWDTVTSAIKLWWGQPTYNYAFLILPISAYLVWRKRDEVRDETPIGSLWGVAVTAAFGLLWLVSDVAEINEGRHIAFVGMLLGILLACLGWRIFKILSFPFLYLWLLVPTGTVLLPATAADCHSHLVIEILRWFGIPVYVEGFFIEVPSGRYHIEPGCAGLNFILATAALAPLYAYLFYRSLLEAVGCGGACPCSCNHHERCTHSRDYRARPLGRTKDSISLTTICCTAGAFSHWSCSRRDTRDPSSLMASQTRSTSKTSRFAVPLESCRTHGER